MSVRISRGSVKSLVGVLVRDMPRFFAALRHKNGQYLALCNRDERLVRAPDGSGYRCDWQWTSELHAPKYLPQLGRALLRRTFRDHPIDCANLPQANGEPRITFIIGHRGDARLLHLKKTIDSIAAQASVPVECVVVEQDVKSRLRGVLPSWVKVVHSPPPSVDMPYCRSWAFNVGRQHASAPILVLHDNDMLVPLDYASEIERRVSQGFEVINLKRFIFYCTSEHTTEIFAGRENLTARPPEAIVQNLEGGGSVAITCDAFDQIGGMDESFIGWGGEDNEFWERAQTRKVWPFGYLPLLHLWHHAQPRKGEIANPALLLYQSLRHQSVDSRIANLASKARGQKSGPNGFSGIALGST